MKFIANMSLTSRFRFLGALILLVIFTIIAFFLYYSQKLSLLSEAKQEMHVHLNDLITPITVLKKQRQERMPQKMHHIQSALMQYGQLEVIDSIEHKLQLLKDDQVEKQWLSLPLWKIGKEKIQGNTALVDTLSKYTGTEISIFQRVKDVGYVRISTTVTLDNAEKNRAVGTYMPFEHSLVRKIEDGQEYTTPNKIGNQIYLASYKPIYFDKQIVGILSVGYPLLEVDKLKPLFADKVYYRQGYPFLMTRSGDLLIHPTMAGQNLAQYDFFKQMEEARVNGVNNFRYLWPEEGHNQKWKQLYFSYLDEFDIYVAVTLYEEDMAVISQRSKMWFLAILLLSIVFFSIGIHLMVSPIISDIQGLMDVINRLSKGHQVEKMPVKGNNELARTKASLNVLIDGLEATASFANAIEQADFSTDFKALSDKDILGKALLDMRDSLRQAQESESKRQKEEQKRNWINEGITKISDIVRQSYKQIDGLADLIVEHVVHYLDVNQGGLFLYNDDQQENPYLELLSAYAYDRKRFEQKKILPGEGLVGMAAVERETIRLTDVPNEYIMLQSGLGESNPRNLLIVPLKTEKAVMGVLELASFTIFEEHQIEFVERIAQIVASTLASARINARTNRLLEESEKKSEIMAAQEEQMRQNMEELQAAQEEIARKGEEQERMIEALNQENEQRLNDIKIKELETQGMLDALSQTTALVEYDTHGQLTYVNDFAVKLYQRPKEALLGMNQRTFLGECADKDNQAKFNSLWSKVLAGESVRGIFQLTINKKKIWLSETYSPISNNEKAVYKILKVAYDITSEKEHAHELEENMKELEKLKESQKRSMDKLLQKADRKELRLRNRLSEKEQEVKELKQTIEKLKNQQDTD